MKHNNISITKVLFISLIIATVFSCDDFVKIDPPRTDLIKATVFENDATAEAAMVDVYASMYSGRFAGGGASSISYCTALAADEMIHYSNRSSEEFKQFNNNALQINNSILTGMWTDLYATIYKSNSIIEGVMSSTKLSNSLKAQLEGEAKFIRAFCYFYLVNLWGDVPLLLTIDYRINNSSSSTAKDQIYQQILSDLIDSQKLLLDNYSLSNGERVRANKGVATALLARVFLFTKNWTNAEAESTKLIDDTSLYSLEESLTTVFGTKSKEAILQFWYWQYPIEFSTYLIHPAFGGPLYGGLSPILFDSFDSNDFRLNTWTLKVPINGVTYFRAMKYQTYNNPPIDYSTVLRLAEQYLIRAEARIQQNKIDDAAADINIIRTRAGLPNTLATDPQNLLREVMAERRAELFGEWGHRWFDLIRTDQADKILAPSKPEWDANDIRFPVPEIQVINNPNTTQTNPG